jgi:hypothetical protein
MQEPVIIQQPNINKQYIKSNSPCNCCNMGINNTGCYNCGDYNCGGCNVGNRNIGFCNVGDNNRGCCIIFNLFNTSTTPN